MSLLYSYVRISVNVHTMDDITKEVKTRNYYVESSVVVI